MKFSQCLALVVFSILPNHVAMTALEASARAGLLGRFHQGALQESLVADANFARRQRNHQHHKQRQQPRQSFDTPHGAAGAFGEAASAFSDASKQNRSQAVQQCTRTVQAEIDSYKMIDGSDEFAIPKLEIWCNVYNVRMAEKQMRKQPARAVLFNETKGLWKKACKDARLRTEKLLAGSNQEEDDVSLLLTPSTSTTPPFPTQFYCEALHDAFFRISFDDVFPMLVGTYSQTQLPPLASSAQALDFLKVPRPCCEPHLHKGCHEAEISRCVCAKDPSCCNDKWDLRCAELVELLYTKDDMNQWIQCGRCPVPNSWTL